MADEISQSNSAIANELADVVSVIFTPDVPNFSSSLPDSTKSISVDVAIDIFPNQPSSQTTIRTKIPTMDWNFDLEIAAVTVITKVYPYLATSEANKNAKWEQCLNELRKMPEFRVAFEKCGVRINIFYLNKHLELIVFL